MNRQPFEKPPRWWSPHLSPTWLRVWRPLRRLQQRFGQRLDEVCLSGGQHVSHALAQGHGVLITPNHSSHADGFAIYAAADQLGVPLYAMMAWQVFARGGWLHQVLLQHHGAFSVDREGIDVAALRQAREILQREPFPLVIFPEGEVYHLNERLTPFRDGPAAIALMAARKSERPVSCIPCAIRYYYTEDPTEELLALMDRLELELHWPPRPELTLVTRIYQLAEGILALKEIEFTGHCSSGPIPERIGRLMESLLDRIERKYAVSNVGRSIPERVKTARHALITKLANLDETSPQRTGLMADLDELFLVIQAFSYPGDYVAERPSLERIAETLDKFEEDLLRKPTATVRGRRRAEVRCGEPITLSAGTEGKYSSATLTQALQEQVAGLLGADRSRVSRGAVRFA